MRAIYINEEKQANVPRKWNFSPAGFVDAATEASLKAHFQGHVGNALLGSGTSVLQGLWC
ncbi:hypothetical protein CXF74_02550 [Psychromonas sp. Urea-02u-13]|nr:hypothetical protein CXF74_02550 [Psychromonas sp. Urea-02u-13]